MKTHIIKLQFFTLFTLMLHFFSNAQGILNTSGAYLVTQGTGSIVLNDAGLTNNGTFTAGSGTVIFTGTTATANSFVAGSSATGFYNLTVNKSSNDIQLNSNLNVSNTLNFSGGNLSIAANTLTLNGTLTGTGNLIGSPASSLVLGGAVGTLQFDQTSAATRSLNNLTVNSSASATLGNALELYGVVTLTSASLNLNDKAVTLKSTSSATARVADLTGSTLSNASNITVERYIANPQRSWHLLSGKAVTGSQTIKEAWQENGGSIVAGIGTLLTSNLYNGSNGYDVSSISSSILTHNQGGLSGPSWNYNLANTNSTVLSSNQGYMLFVRGDRNYTPANGPATSPTVLRTHGTLTQGTLSAITISATGTGRTLVGNPYASPIDFENIHSTANLDQNFYTWDPSASGAYGVGGFLLVERNPDGSYQQTPYSGSPSVNANSRYISSGQAFFLKASGADASLVFGENAKAGLTPIVTPLTALQADEQLYCNLMIVNPGNIESLADGFRIRFNEGYLAAITDDIEKMGNFTENISSYREGKKLIVERRPLIGSFDTIFVRITNTGIKDYRLKFGTFDFAQAGITAFLQDTYLGTTTAIDLSGNLNVVDFSVTADPASALPDRFLILFSGSLSPLPVTFTGIKAMQQNASVAVEWNVGGEYNIKNYDVERSTDGVHFIKLAIVTATGNLGNSVTYKWTDLYPVDGNNFYRIRSNSNSAEIKYSSVAKVVMGRATPDISVYPNPVINKTINIRFTGADKGVYQLQLVNSLGQTVLTQQLTLTVNSGTQSISAGNLVKGNYRLIITDPGNKRTILSLLIAE